MREAQGVVLSNNLTGTRTTPINPLVVNATSGNFHLHSNSPAINAGFALAGLSPKTLMGPRGRWVAAWDIGAYEFGGAPPACTKPGGDCTAPSVPTGLTATINRAGQSQLG